MAAAPGRRARRPAAAEWVVRAVVVDGEVVGHAGFHGPPDASGDRRGRLHRRARSCAVAVTRHAALQALLARAAASGRVRVVRATVGPGNAASLAVVQRAGFRHVGEQEDEVDGLELVFERELRTG